MKNLLKRVIGHKNFKLYALLLSQGLFLASLTQDWYSGTPTLWILLFGWAGLYFGWAALAWFANPFIIIAWKTIKRKPVTSLLFSILAVGAAVSYLFFKTVYNPDSESIDTMANTVASYNVYYWLCLLSIH
jgi:hypothetical protein